MAPSVAALFRRRLAKPAGDVEELAELAQHARDAQSGDMIQADFATETGADRFWREHTHLHVFGVAGQERHPDHPLSREIVHVPSSWVAWHADGRHWVTFPAADVAALTWTPTTIRPLRALVTDEVAV